MTDPDPDSPSPSPSVSPAADSWDGMLATLRKRYPGQKDSVLFCVHKLQQNPDLSLRDFREEAALYGIPTAGRALHSAKVLLGLASNKPRAPREAEPAKLPAPTAPGRVKRARRPERDDDGDSIETKVLDAVRQIQSAAGEEADRLRAAVKQAIAILQAALDD